MNNSLPDKSPGSRLVQFRNILIKGFVLFWVVNCLFALINPLPTLGRISGYNFLFPGRKRLPYGDNPERAYNLSLFQLDAMFASHEISAGTKPNQEYRVIVIGDSSTWGYLLRPEETLTNQLNLINLTTPDDRIIRFYNLGYPVMSLTKDLLILSRSLRYKPDMIIWMVTLESFPVDKQLYPPLLQNNATEVQKLILDQKLHLDPNNPALVHPTLWDRTIVGQRRTLADIIRLQLYGIQWAATGIDQDIPSIFTPHMEDLPNNTMFHNFPPPHLNPTTLSLDVLQAGKLMAAGIPIFIINEPIFISQGINSNIRYNYYYPRWVYDDYRQILYDSCQINHWNCLDLWNAIDPAEFTNTAVHMTPRGTAQTADLIWPTIISFIQKK